MQTPRLNRRGFFKNSTLELLQVGGIASLGLGLPEVLQAGARRRSAPSTPTKSCIFIVQQGGASHLDTWDLKPDAPDDIHGPYKPIATAAPGVWIGELLPRLGRLAHRFCLIRSMTHNNFSHEGAMNVCLSGQSKPLADAPFFGSTLSKLRPAERNVPPYVWLQEMEYDAGYRYHGGGFLGSACAPLLIGKGLNNTSTPGFRVTTFDPLPGMTLDDLRRRRELLASVQATAPVARRSPAEEVFEQFQDRAFELITGPEARSAFDLDREPESMRDRYGRNPLGQNLLMARRLIESGVRLVSVHAYTGNPPGHQFRTVNCWDMHGAGDPGICGDSIFGTGPTSLGWVLPRTDQAVAALLEDLDQRGLLASTLVVMVGEFGRTPRIFPPRVVPYRPFVGRDHWAPCYSAMLAGGGIRGGMVHGDSDKIGAFVKDAPVSPEDFGATLLHALGVNPETRLVDQLMRPRSASAGKPILSLFG